MAAHQTAGRGRLDRRWDAPAGANLLVSMLFRDVPRARSRADPTRRLGGSRGMHRDGRCVADAQVAERSVARRAQARRRAGPGRRASAGPTTWSSASGSTSGGRPRKARQARRCSGAGRGARGDARRLRPAAGRHHRRRTAASLATIGQSVRVELPGSAVVGRALDVLAGRPSGRARRVRHHPPLRHRRRRASAVTGPDPAQGARNADHPPNYPRYVLVADAAPRSRRRNRLPSLLAMTAIVGVCGATGMLVAARKTIDSVDRVPGVAAHLTPSANGGRELPAGRLRQQGRR